MRRWLTSFFFYEKLQSLIYLYILKYQHVSFKNCRSLTTVETNPRTDNVLSMTFFSYCRFCKSNEAPSCTHKQFSHSRNSLNNLDEIALNYVFAYGKINDF